MKEKSSKTIGESFLKASRFNFFNWMSFQVYMLWPERWWSILV